MQSTDNNIQKEVDLGKITLEVYNSIAVWHNDDFDTPKLRGEALKLVAHQIVEDVISSVFSSVGVNTKLEINRGGVKVEEGMNEGDVIKQALITQEEEKQRLLNEILKNHK